MSYIATVCSDGNVNNAVLLVEFEKNIFEFTLNYAFGEWLREGTVKHQVEDNHPRSSAVRVQISPELLAYSLWLSDSCLRFAYYTSPHMSSMSLPPWFTVRCQLLYHASHLIPHQ